MNISTNLFLDNLNEALDLYGEYLLNFSNSSRAYFYVNRDYVTELRSIIDSVVVSELDIVYSSSDKSKVTEQDLNQGLYEHLPIMIIDVNVVGDFRLSDNRAVSWRNLPTTPKEDFYPSPLDFFDLPNEENDKLSSMNSVEFPSILDLIKPEYVSLADRNFYDFEPHSDWYRDIKVGHIYSRELYKQELLRREGLLTNQRRNMFASRLFGPNGRGALVDTSTITNYWRAFEGDYSFIEGDLITTEADKDEVISYFTNGIDMLFGLYSDLTDRSRDNLARIFIRLAELYKSQKKTECGLYSKWTGSLASVLYYGTLQYNSLVIMHRSTGVKHYVAKIEYDDHMNAFSSDAKLSALQKSIFSYFTKHVSIEIPSKDEMGAFPDDTILPLRAIVDKNFIAKDLNRMLLFIGHKIHCGDNLAACYAFRKLKAALVVYYSYLDPNVVEQINQIDL